MKSNNSKRKLFIVNDISDNGHGKDIKTTIKNIGDDENCILLRDQLNKPEIYFQTVIEEILLSNIIFLDALKFGSFQKEALTLFGIAFALNKNRTFFHVDDNSLKKENIGDKYLAGFILKTNSYLELTDILKNPIEFAKSAPNTPSDLEYDSFSIFGANANHSPDLRKQISCFAEAHGRHARFYDPPPGENIHVAISNQVSARNVSMICLNKKSDNSVYIALGLAIGLGIPILVLCESNEPIPKVLQGYEGIIVYENMQNLSEQLKSYSDIFFSSKVRKWEGSTYYFLLSKLRNQFEKSKSKKEFLYIETIVQKIAEIKFAPRILAYILLGDIYRNRNRYFDNWNIEYLNTSIKFYNKALEINPENQGCIDNINVARNQIKLIKLLKDNKYEDVTSLIYLIGNAISTEQFVFIKDFLLSEVKKLIKSNNYLDAVAILAAILIHDKSEETLNLWKKIDPQRLIELIKKYQLEIIEIRKNYIDVVGQLSKAENEIIEANKLQTKLKDTEKFDGANVFVNFGRWWAIVQVVSGHPKISRNGEHIVAQEGMVIKRGDYIFDGNGIHIMHLLSELEAQYLELGRQMHSSGYFN